MSITYKTNEDNTFVAGMSNGGFMSSTLGGEKSDIFKAVAPITGTMSGYDWQNCSPAYKIPILQMSGTNDRTVPWDGTMNTALGWGGAPHILDVMEFWSDLNACTQDEIIDFPDIDKSDYSTVSLTKKKGGSYNNEVWFYKNYSSHVRYYNWSCFAINFGLFRFRKNFFNISSITKHIKNTVYNIPFVPWL